MLTVSDTSTVRISRHQRRSTLLEKFSISRLLGTLVVGLFLIPIIVLSVLYDNERNRKTTTANDSDLCLTPYCIQAANYLIESIDEKVKPCENFYEFACGTRIKNTRMWEGGSNRNPFKELKTQVNNAIIDLLSSSPSNGTVEPKAVINARRLYASCIDEEAIEAEGVDTILSFINTELGGWPILQGSAWNASTFDLSRLLLKLNQHNHFIFYKIGTIMDNQNASIRSIEIGQTEISEEDLIYSHFESKHASAYQKFMRDLAVALSTDTSMIDDDIDASSQFEKTIAESFSMSIIRQPDENAVRITLDDLSRTMDTNFDFLEYLRRLYLSANVTLVDTDIVIVSELEYLRNISLLIEKQSPRTIQNYAVWRFILNRVWNMPQRYRIIKQQYDLTFRVTQPSRSLTCATFVKDNMDFAVSKLYINKYFDQQARKESFEMIDNIRNAFIDMVNQSTWMDSVSKKKTIKRTRAIVEKVGYPDYLDGGNVSKLEQDYAEYNFNSSSIQNIFHVLQLIAKNNLQSLRQPVDRESWFGIVPIDVNARYYSGWNDMIFPAALLQAPFFHKDAPKYLNYGGIGTIMGHEITHDLDNQGQHHDQDGNVVPLWTNETIEALNEHKQCIIKQYSNYTVTQHNFHINGIKTLDENIADNGGLKEAFFAYQNWAKTHKNVDKKLPGLVKYSVEQMFFLNFAQPWCTKMTDIYAMLLLLHDPHSPSPLRILGSTSNFVEFDRVFGCKPGQGNSRVNKCTVW